MKCISLLGSACLGLLFSPFSPATEAAAHKAPVKVAVIGGMTLGGMWPELVEQFTKDTGWPVELVTTGPKAMLSEAMKGGAVDLLTMHASDEATELVANGICTDMQPWARNEHCIMGPVDDPAGIRGMNDGAAALKKIASSKSAFVDFIGVAGLLLGFLVQVLGGVQKSWTATQRTVSRNETVHQALPLLSSLVSTAVMNPRQRFDLPAHPARLVSESDLHFVCGPPVSCWRAFRMCAATPCFSRGSTGTVCWRPVASMSSVPGTPQSCLLGCGRC